MSTYTPLTWCSSRQVLSTVAGVLVLGIISCGVGYNNVIPIVLNAGTRAWALGIPNLSSVGLVLLGTVNTLPGAPQWEQPLRHRTRVAHACMWSFVIALGAIGPAFGAALLPDQGGLYPSSQIAFYFTVAGACGAAIHLLGRSAGTAMFLAITAATIAIEQATNHFDILADVRTSPSWLTCAIALTLAIAAAYRTGGHPPSGPLTTRIHGC